MMLFRYFPLKTTFIFILMLPSVQCTYMNLIIKSFIRGFHFTLIFIITTTLHSKLIQNSSLSPRPPSTKGSVAVQFGGFEEAPREDQPSGGEGDFLFVRSNQVDDCLLPSAITPMTKGLEPEQGGRVHPAGHEQEIRFHLGRPGWSTCFLSTCSLEMPSLIPKCRDLHQRRSQQWLRWRKPSSTTPSSLSPPSPEFRCLQLIDQYQGEVTY